MALLLILLNQSVTSCPTWLAVRDQVVQVDEVGVLAQQRLDRLLGLGAGLLHHRGHARRATHHGKARVKVLQVERIRGTYA